MMRLWPLLLLSISSSSCARSSDPTILALGKEAVHRSDFERHLQGLESRRGSTVDPSVREALLESFLEERVLVLEARSRGLLPSGSSPEAEDAAVQRMLSESVLSKIQVTDDEIAAYYKEHEPEFRTPERVTLRQILVPTSNEARDVLWRIQRDPKSFDSLARSRSKSPEASEGGLMGVFSRGQLPRELEDGAFALAPRAAQIVQTGLGFHVLRVEAREAARDRSLGESRAEIQDILSRQKSDQSVRQFVRELMARAKVNHEAAILPRQP